LSPPISTAIKAARQLGIPSLLDYARYQIGLRSGYYRWKSTQPNNDAPGSIHAVFELPSQESLQAVLGDRARDLIQQADEVSAGKVRLFGNPPVPLQLVPPGELAHWTYYAKNKLPGGEEDIKLIWEPARFGWAFILGRAYILTGNEIYARTFWEHTETFLSANPAYLGPNWYSGQEAALRLFAFVFAGQVFAPSSHSSTARQDHLRNSIAEHAARLPLTLVYAKAQNNNHLLTEAAALYTAGLALPEHPQARRWKDIGWGCFNRAIQAQISGDGAYIQYSTNYHRLMLQTILWVASLSDLGRPPRPLPVESQTRAASATRWLMALLDPLSGRVPNLGPNDGAYILPFSTLPFEDFRPVLQAAASVFLGKCVLPPGPVDEMRLWLGTYYTAQGILKVDLSTPPHSWGGGDGDSLTSRKPCYTEDNPQSESPSYHKNAPVEPHCLRSSVIDSWVYLRAARYSARPGHADQLHLDLWWRGLNVALDPGTFRYNSSPPWDNSLARTEVHNTVCINNTDQMTRAGRFLWLDWAQAQIQDYKTSEDGSFKSITAQHAGYSRMGVLHNRQVAARDDGWNVLDELIPTEPYASPMSLVQARLHWLLPDWPWEILDSGSQDQNQYSYILRIKSRYGWISLEVRMPVPVHRPVQQSAPEIQLARAGELMYGAGEVSPIAGWSSPSYNHKIPALAFSIRQIGRLPIRFSSHWIFP
jgi:hypothetical protein